MGSSPNLFIALFISYHLSAPSLPRTSVVITRSWSTAPLVLIWLQIVLQSCIHRSSHLVALEPKGQNLAPVLHEETLTVPRIMGKKKSNSANAVRALESTVSPIVEINYSEPLFAVAAHPTKPILLQGLATGHVYCTKYDDVKLEEQQAKRREENELLEKEAFAKGKISAINKSVSQTKKK